MAFTVCNSIGKAKFNHKKAKRKENTKKEKIPRLRKEEKQKIQYLKLATEGLMRYIEKHHLLIVKGE